MRAIQRKGLSLPEVLIGAGLLLVMSVMSLSLLELELRLDRSSRSTAELHQSAVVARSRILRDLMEAPSDPQVLLFDTRWVAIASARSADGIIQFDTAGRPA